MISQLQWKHRGDKLIWNLFTVPLLEKDILGVELAFQKIKDIKEKMEEGVGVIEGGNELLMERVNSLEESFQKRLNTSFKSLDKILQSMVMEYARRINGNGDELVL